MKPHILSAVVGGVAVAMMGVTAMSPAAVDYTAQTASAPTPSATAANLTEVQPMTTSTTPMSFRPQVTASPPPPPLD